MRKYILVYDGENWLVAQAPTLIDMDQNYYVKARTPSLRIAELIAKALEDEDNKPSPF